MVSPFANIMSIEVDMAASGEVRSNSVMTGLKLRFLRGTVSFHQLMTTFADDNSLDHVFQINS